MHFAALRVLQFVLPNTIATCGYLSSILTGNLTSLKLCEKFSFSVAQHTFHLQGAPDPALGITASTWKPSSLVLNSLLPTVLMVFFLVFAVGLLCFFHLYQPLRLPFFLLKSALGLPQAPPLKNLVNALLPIAFGSTMQTVLFVELCILPPECIPFTFRIYPCAAYIVSQRQRSSAGELGIQVDSCHHIFWKMDRTLNRAPLPHW